VESHSVYRLNCVVKIRTGLEHQVKSLLTSKIIPNALYHLLVSYLKLSASIEKGAHYCMLGMRVNTRTSTCVRKQPSELLKFYYSIIYKNQAITIIMT